MEDYFDVESILATEPRVYVTFLVDGKGLGHLDDKGEADIPAGARVAIPFWLAESLAERRIVSVAVPKCYTGNMRASLRADPTSVDLQVACPRYFTLGVQVARLLRAPALVPMLITARATRAWRIVDEGANDMLHMLRKLDNCERALFFCARASALSREQWVERRLTKLKAARTITDDDKPLSRALTRAKRSLASTDITSIAPRPEQRTRVR